MAVDDVGTRAGDKGAELGEREKVGGTGIAGDAGLADAQRPAARYARKGLIDAFRARGAVEEDPDFVTKRRLRRSEVDDMAKQAAERRPQHMDDFQFFRNHARNRPPRGSSGETPRRRVY